MGGRTRIRADRSQANMGLANGLLRFRPFHDAYESGDSDVRRPIFTSNCRKKKKNHNQEKDDNAGILNDSRQSLNFGGLAVVVFVVVVCVLLLLLLLWGCCCYWWLFFCFVFVFVCFCVCCFVLLLFFLGGGVWHRHPFQSSSLWSKHCTGRTLFGFLIVIWGAGIAQRLERRTRDQKVSGSNPGRSCGTIFFFSGVSFYFCSVSYFGIRSTPVLPQ